MRRLFLISLFVFLAGCAALPKVERHIEWPSGISNVTGEGELETAWKKEHYSGPFVVKMAYPDLLVFEVYGAFGQTVVQIKKEGDSFLLIAGDEKTTDEAVFEKKYGFSVGQLMEDLAMRGKREETAGGWQITRRGYAVSYGQDRKGRRKICWMGAEGSICLSFDDISFSAR